MVRRPTSFTSHRHISAGSTGTNYNLVDKVERGPGDRVVWHIINSPDGRFVYDYDLIRANQRAIERMCLDCHKVKVRGIKRLCDTCAKIRKRASNRKSQVNRRVPYPEKPVVVRAEALTECSNESLPLIQPAPVQAEAKAQMSRIVTMNEMAGYPPFASPFDVAAMQCCLQGDWWMRSGSSFGI